MQIKTCKDRIANLNPLLLRCRFLYTKVERKFLTITSSTDKYLLIMVKNTRASLF